MGTFPIPGDIMMPPKLGVMPDACPTGGDFMLRIESLVFPPPN